MNSPRISVVIPCYNQGRFLAEAIESVMQQDYPNKEIIVVNDGATDNTRQVALSFGVGIRYIEQENRGLSAARNAGIHIAQGRYIALLDADDLLCEGSLSLRARYLEAHPDVWLVCGDLIVFNEKCDLGLRSDLYGKPQNPENFRWETIEYIALSSATMIRRDAFEKYGYFDENLKVGAEDLLLWAQYSRHFNMAYIPRPLAKYRRHENNVTSNLVPMNASNRYAFARLVDENLKDYPASYQAKLLYRRAAAAFRYEPFLSFRRFLWQAVIADPRQIGFGGRVLAEGVGNTINRALKRDSG